MSDSQGAAPNLETIPEDILNPADIQNAVRIIDFAAEQGAFKGWEIMKQVLIVRNRLNNFVLKVMPQPTPTEETEVA